MMGMRPGHISNSPSELPGPPGGPPDKPSVRPPEVTGSGPLESVPFVDLASMHSELRAELLGAFDRVLGAGSFTLGEEVDGFEREFARYCGTAHSVGVNSGTAAITLALLAAGIGRGDEVIVPAHTYIASALGIVHAGATPVFCDVDDETGLLDAASASVVITDRTAAILAVHLYGQMCDMDAISALARRHGLAVFEDAAQAHGASYKGRRAGSFGLASCFSFYPSKNLGALGDGGAICTSDPALTERCRQLRNIGQRVKGEHVALGFNERLDGLQAAMLRAKLPYLDGWNDARRRSATCYRVHLGVDVRPVRERPDGRAVYHLFPVRIAHREAIAGGLKREGVHTGIHYSPAVHLHSAFQSLGAPGPGSFPAAESWAAEELSLPMSPHLEIKTVKRVARLVNERIDSPIDGWSLEAEGGST